ncbi:MAG: ATP-binding protein [Fuerstiella sp.]
MIMFGQPAAKSWYFSGAVQAEALNRLLYVAEQGESFVLLQGDQGVGKTILLNQVQSECRRSGMSAILINMAALDQAAFVTQLCGALSIVAGQNQSQGSLMTAIRDEIAGRTLCNHKTVVLLDDLHRTTESPEPVIQFLTAINHQTAGGITVIAATENGLSDRLQRLSALKVNLSRLNPDDAESFVHEKLRIAGVAADCMTDDAMVEILQYGDGSPGRLKRVCDVLKIANTTDPQVKINSAIVAALARETLLADVA